MNSAWNPQFHQNSALFEPILPAYQNLRYQHDHWPDLNSFQCLADSLQGSVTNKRKKPITFVPQIETNKNFEQQYETMIYQMGEVQTRLSSWHDFFQVLVWCTFPKIKAELNAMHFNAASQRLKNNPDNKQRSHLENFLTLFDECGAIIVYQNDEIPYLIREFRWKELFVSHKESFIKEINCIIFGHGMYEKAINPYIGMTSQCLFLKQSSNFFLLPTVQKTQHIDAQISQSLAENNLWSTEDLHPFPLLGVPGWHKDNVDPVFYENKNYFRNKPLRKKIN